MKNNFLKIVFCYFFVFWCLEFCTAQKYSIYNGDTINRIIDDSIKTGKWIEFKNNKPVEEVEYIQNKKNGLWTQYYPDGSIRMKLSYIDNKPEGAAIGYYDTTGHLKETGIWKNNRWEGTYNMYYPKGGIRQELTYNSNGKLEGIQKYYYENGIIQAIYVLENGTQQGFVNYDITGVRLGHNYVNKNPEGGGYYTYIPPSNNKAGDNTGGIYVTNINKDGKSIDDAFNENKELFVNFVDNVAKMENSAVFQRENLLKTQIENQKQKLAGVEKLRQIDLLTQNKSLQEATIKTSQLELERETALKEKKSKEVILLNQEKKLKDTELKQQSIIRNTFIAGFSLMLILAGISYRNFKRKQKDNLIITNQKHIVEEKQKEITDSINYAQRIQRSILPPLEEVRAKLPDSFILFKPKDIVSGDFYWFAETKGQILIAVSDCTGHGVPGAFMSTIGSEKLNEAVKDSSDVSEILNLVNLGMKKVLRQSDKMDSTRDGMDIALCSFNKEMTQVEFAGANRPLWVIRKDKIEIEETKATKVAIGGLTEDEQVFAKHTFDLQKGDTVYLFSDGYADQFSPQDKKLMTRKFKEIILSIQNKSMEDQRIFLGSFIDNWKGNMEQTDDILVIGVRV